MNRISKVSLSLTLAVFFTMPSLVLYLGIIMAMYHKWLSGICCLMLAWNVGKLVQSKYEEK